MGLEFVMRKRFRKKWKNSVNVLAKADLLSSTPDWINRRVNAHCTTTDKIEAGDRVVVFLDEDNHIVAAKGHSPVAVVTAPPMEVVESMRAACSGGVAYATVESVRPISKTVALSIEIPPPMDDK